MLLALLGDDGFLGYIFRSLGVTTISTCRSDIVFPISPTVAECGNVIGLPVFPGANLAPAYMATAPTRIKHTEANTRRRNGIIVLSYPLGDMSQSTARSIDQPRLILFLSLGSGTPQSLDNWVTVTRSPLYSM